MQVGTINFKAIAFFKKYAGVACSHLWLLWLLRVPMLSGAFAILHVPAVHAELADWNAFVRLGALLVSLLVTLLRGPAVHVAGRVLPSAVFVFTA